MYIFVPPWRRFFVCLWGPHFFRLHRQRETLRSHEDCRKEKHALCASCAGAAGGVSGSHHTQGEMILQRQDVLARKEPFLPCQGRAVVGGCCASPTHQKTRVLDLQVCLHCPTAYSGGLCLPHEGGPPAISRVVSRCLIAPCVVCLLVKMPTDAIFPPPRQLLFTVVRILWLPLRTTSG